MGGMRLGEAVNGILGHATAGTLSERVVRERLLGYASFRARHQVAEAVTAERNRCLRLVWTTGNQRLARRVAMGADVEWGVER